MICGGARPVSSRTSRRAAARGEASLGSMEPEQAAHRDLWGWGWLVGWLGLARGLLGWGLDSGLGLGGKAGRGSGRKNEREWIVKVIRKLNS